MNSLKLWLTLRVHGRQAYEQLIDRQLQLARSFAEWIESSDDFEVAAPQVLPIVTFRLKRTTPSQAAAAHAVIVEEVTRDGRRWISETVANGSSVMRMMVISYLTGQRQLQALQSALVSAAKLSPALHD
jgi:glutamate/tyrosine decarboxylase-like PLP-dependent enzyme